MVVVANLLNGVVLDVQPFQILRYEGVIEPLQAVRGDVEPLELALCRQQAVDIRYLGKIYLRLEILSGETLSLWEKIPKTVVKKSAKICVVNARVSFGGKIRELRFWVVSRAGASRDTSWWWFGGFFRQPTHHNPTLMIRIQKWVSDCLFVLWVC
jgi:hypothetical protein